MNILITGGAGFIGSSLAEHLQAIWPSSNVCCMDNFWRNGSALNRERLSKLDIPVLYGDIRYQSDFSNIPFSPDVIVHVAAEPSVLAGTKGDAEYVVATNLTGTINCLELAKKHNAKFIFISSSRVYSILALENQEVYETRTAFELSYHQSQKGATQHGVTEKFSTDGIKSLYGATKLSSEMMVQEYSDLFGFPCVINRCGVVAGPWQMGMLSQGIITSWVANHFWNRPLKYIGYGGTGKQVRDVLNVKDLCELIAWQIINIDLVSGEVYNVGGGKFNSISLRELTNMCISVTGNTVAIDSDLVTRNKDIKLYISNTSKIQEVSGWAPKISVYSTVEQIYHWLLEYDSTLKNIIG